MARVLIVDDSITYRQIMSEILENGGHTVVGEAEDGIEAIKLFKELRPDVTTMDITMPNMDGLAALKWIMEADPDASVIVVSSAAQSKKLAEAADYGAADFLPKPFESMNILNAIDRITKTADLKNKDAGDIDALLDSLDLDNLVD